METRAVPAPHQCFREYPSLQPSRSALKVAQSLARILYKSNNATGHTEQHEAEKIEKTATGTVKEEGEEKTVGEEGEKKEGAGAKEKTEDVPFEALFSTPVPTVVVPKLHGSNVLIHYSPVYGVTWGRRGAFLTPEEEHYGARAAGALLDMDAKVKALFDALSDHVKLIAVPVSVPVSESVSETKTESESEFASTSNPGLEAIFVYGEVYGGQYTHPDVAAAKPSRKPVQRGIWYSPQVNIAVFDVAVQAAGRTRFLSFNDAFRACNELGIPFVSPAYRSDSLLDACQWAEAHVRDDALAHFNPLSLPLLGADKNAGEGFVVRTVAEYAWGDARALAKLKNPSFSEVQSGADKKKVKHLDNACVQTAMELAERTLNSARAASVASKLDAKKLVIANIKAFANDLANDALAEPTLRDEMYAVFSASSSADARLAKQAFWDKATSVARFYLLSL